MKGKNLVDDEGGSAEVWSAVRDGSEMQQMNISACEEWSRPHMWCIASKVGSIKGTTEF